MQLAGPPPNVLRTKPTLLSSSLVIGSGNQRSGLFSAISGALRVSEEALFPNWAVLETKFLHWGRYIARSLTNRREFM